MKIPAKRSYPKEIIIGENHWNIKFKRNLGKDTSGLCDPSNKTIYLKMGMSEAETFSTLIHEILHSFEDEYLEKHMPHRYIYMLEKAIMDFLIVNF